MCRSVPHSALKSRGTLLPLPALYFFGRLIKSLGLGNKLSSLNWNLGSFTTNRPLPPPPELEAVLLLRLGLGDLEPLAERVKELGSSNVWRRDDPRLRV